MKGSVFLIVIPVKLFVFTIKSFLIPCSGPPICNARVLESGFHTPECNVTKEYVRIFNVDKTVLGIIPTIPIPKPIGARVIVVPITTTLTVEERARRTVSALNGKPLVAIVADKEKPRNTLGVVVKLSIDPLIEENFKVGMGVYFGPLSGTELHFEGKTFRSLEFQEVISTVEEEELPEAYKLQVRHFLLSPSSVEDL